MIPISSIRSLLLKRKALRAEEAPDALEADSVLGFNNTSTPPEASNKKAKLEHDESPNFKSDEDDSPSSLSKLCAAALELQSIRQRWLALSNSSTCRTPPPHPNATTGNTTNHQQEQKLQQLKHDQDQIISRLQQFPDTALLQCLGLHLWRQTILVVIMSQNQPTTFQPQPQDPYTARTILAHALRHFVRDAAVQRAATALTAVLAEQQQQVLVVEDEDDDGGPHTRMVPLLLQVLQAHLDDAVIQCNCTATLCWILHCHTSATAQQHQQQEREQLAPLLVASLQRHSHDATVVGNCLCLWTTLNVADAQLQLQLYPLVEQALQEHADSLAVQHAGIRWLLRQLLLLLPSPNHHATDLQQQDRQQESTEQLEEVPEVTNNNNNNKENIDPLAPPSEAEASHPQLLFWLHQQWRRMVPLVVQALQRFTQEEVTTTTTTTTNAPATSVAQLQVCCVDVLARLVELMGVLPRGGGGDDSNSSSNAAVTDAVLQALKRHPQQLQPSAARYLLAQHNSAQQPPANAAAAAAAAFGGGDPWIVRQHVWRSVGHGAAEQQSQSQQQQQPEEDWNAVFPPLEPPERVMLR